MISFTIKMTSQFSDNGKYFAHLNAEGKLKIWDTQSNIFLQEFVQNIQTSSFTCLHFLTHDNNSPPKGGSPRKKKRRETLTDENCIALGTSTGVLLVYSIAKADVEFTVNSDTNLPISCLSTVNNEFIYAGVNESVVMWNLEKKQLIRKWKCGNEKIVSLLAIPDSSKLLSASKGIKLWDVPSQTLLHTFTGHNSDIVIMQYVHPKNCSTPYFITGSKNDRLLSCWSLSEKYTEKNAIANFLMEDVAQNVIVRVLPNDITEIAATVRSGVLHVYQHTLNGKCGKPLKPKTTIQIVSDTSQDKAVVPIRILAAYINEDAQLYIGYGSDVLLTFENITITSYKKSEFLVRKDPHTSATSKENDVTKLRTPQVGNNVHYVTPAAVNVDNNIASTTKRGIGGQREVPMEKRLENLTLNKLDHSDVPKANNMAQLLIQGLHSKDKNILRTVLFKKDEEMIKNTVKRLPIIVLVSLIQELAPLIQGKTLATHIASLWLRHIFKIHAGILLSNPELASILNNFIGGIEAKLTMQTSLNKLRGRLNLLVSQVGANSSQELTQNEECLLVYNEKDSSDSDNEMLDFMANSDSDNDWEENEEENVEDEQNDEINENNKDSSSDEMSS